MNRTFIKNLSALLLILCLTACGTSNEIVEDNPRTPSVTESATSITSDTELVTSEGIIVFNQGDSLRYLSATGDLHLIDDNLIDDNVSRQSVYRAPFSPNELIYLVEQEAALEFVRFDSSTLTQQTIVTLEEGRQPYHRFKSWSPNGEWVVVTNNIFDPDGQSEYKFTLYNITENAVDNPPLNFSFLGTRLFDYYIWLADGRLLVHLAYADVPLNTPFTFIEGKPNSAQIESFIVDPATGERTDIDIFRDELGFDSEDFFRTPNGLIELQALLQADYGLSIDQQYDVDADTIFAPNMTNYIALEYPIPPNEVSVTRACYQWDIIQKPLLEPSLPVGYYSEDDVAYLSNLSYLETIDKVAFLRWRAPACVISDTNGLVEFTVDLVLSNADETIVVAENVYTATSQHVVRLGQVFWPPDRGNSNAYDVSPNADYLIWLRADPHTHEAWVMQTHIATADTTTVYHVACPDEEFETCRIDNVFWFPADS